MASARTSSRALLSLGMKEHGNEFGQLEGQSTSPTLRDDQTITLRDFL